MLPYKTEAEPGRQLKQQDKLRPPASPESDCDNSFIIPAHTSHIWQFASCDQS